VSVHVDDEALSRGPVSAVVPSLNRSIEEISFGQYSAMVCYIQIWR
jgi:hypothetical protein